MSTPWEKLPKKVQDAILYGTGEEEIDFVYEDGVRTLHQRQAVRGRDRQHRAPLPRDRQRLGARGAVALPGRAPVRRLRRLSPEAAGAGGEDRRQAHRRGRRALDPRRQRTGSPSCRPRFSKKQTEIATRILKEIRERLQFLVDVGLDYLTLSRAAGTLSGGESQRIRLASQIGSGLTGVLYVLDEPSIGLHQRDNARLLETLKHLRDIGNTVIVVEHDEDAILTADHVVDIGPGAGVHGGHVVAQGTPDEIMASAESITGQYLTGVRQIPMPKARRKRDKDKQLTVVGARDNNLKNVTAEIPLGLFTCDHRRLRRRQVHAADRHALQGRGAPAQRRARAPGRARPHRGPGAPRQGHRHRPVADRPHAALQPGHLHRRLHAHPRLVRRPARGQGARLRAGPLLLQRQGRALRGLPGRRRHQDRDALPARRLRHLRRVQGQALQPRDAGGDASRTSRSPTCWT